MKGQAAVCLGLSVIGADRLAVAERGMRRLMVLDDDDLKLIQDWTASVIMGTELKQEEQEIKGKIEEIDLKLASNSSNPQNEKQAKDLREERSRLQEERSRLQEEQVLEDFQDWKNSFNP